jgi:transcriptional regulator with XRE-family HTH domain
VYDDALMTSRQLGKSRARPRIGAPLAALLEERLVTHVELAAALKVHPSIISRWVRNEAGPQKHMLRQIAEHFGVEPLSLIEHDDAPVPA